MPIKIVFIDLLECFRAFKLFIISIGGIASLLFEFLY